MADDLLQNPSRVKVKRTRKRLYEPALPEKVALPANKEEVDDGAATEDKKRLAQALDLVNYYTTIAGATGLLPMPLIDAVATGAVQLKLIHELSHLYGMPFSRQRAKAVLVALVSGVQTGVVVNSAIKFIPVVGYTLAALPSVAASGGLTYAVGRVFVAHFELGGTLLDFDPGKMRAYFREQLGRETKKGA